MAVRKITHARIAEILEGFPKLKDLNGKKLSYAIIRNIRKLKEEVENLNELRYNSPTYELYKSEYSQLVMSQAKKDKDGNFIAAGHNRVSIEDPQLFSEKMKELNEKYAEELGKVKEEDDKFNKFYNEPIEVDFYTFSSEDIPDYITVEQRELLIEMEESE